MTEEFKESFLGILRDFLHDDAWIEASPKHAKIFITILERCTYQEKTFNIKGNLIVLKPGQLCASIRKIAEWTGSDFTKDDVLGCLKHFFKMKKLRQEVLHGKSVITIDDSVIYKKKNNTTPTETPTTFLQRSYTNKKDNNTDNSFDDDECASAKNKLSQEEIELLEKCISLCQKKNLDLTESSAKRMIHAFGVASFKKFFNETLQEKRSCDRQRSFAAILNDKLNKEIDYGINDADEQGCGDVHPELNAEVAGTA